MIYTVTCNPALDYRLSVEEPKMGITNRCRGESLTFGGKGINVAVVLSRLGQPVTAWGFAAGFTGEELVRQVKASGVAAEFIALQQGMTRINVKLRGETETEFNAAGPTVDEQAWSKLTEYAATLQKGDTLVLSGSGPVGRPMAYAQLASSLSRQGVRVVVDAAGDFLRSTLPYRPFLIKPNRQELEELTGRPLLSEEDVIEAAAGLQDMGAQQVLVSLGAQGAVLLDEQGQVYRCEAPSVTVADTVGAGDSMVAGFLAGLEEGPQAALTLGVAAGSATAAAEGLARGEDILAVYNRMNKGGKS